MANELRNNVFNNFMDPMEGFFNGLGKNMVNTNKMKTDVIEHDKDYQVNVELPGFKKADIDLDYRDDTLSIHAVHDLNKESKDDNGKLLRSERTSSDVSRAFYLPNVEADKINAGYDGGILSITLPKSVEKESKHSISIN
ncbi:Hsp20/alpha crystallin family protein [Apilactobacillus bombintestini]|uniref:Hsp20/alpha crystallin family protein n=1 Tax=Apilactobacillus bombintestini TaxID=2419772 RepID=A0A387AS01_9LACO|nr:Hsp20/alpha crystallin family protein [Apilactobacillus bombintestini]AYF91995.1 Hsp20/alpha crystallin family protein [Apilactobacillus bombintestini]